MLWNITPLFSNSAQSTHFHAYSLNKQPFCHLSFHKALDINERSLYNQTLIYSSAYYGLRGVLNSLYCIEYFGINMPLKTS